MGRHPLTFEQLISERRFDRDNARHRRALREAEVTEELERELEAVVNEHYDGPEQFRPHLPGLIRGYQQAANMHDRSRTPHLLRVIAKLVQGGNS